MADELDAGQEGRLKFTKRLGSIKTNHKAVHEKFRTDECDTCFLIATLTMTAQDLVDCQNRLAEGSRR